MRPITLILAILILIGSGATQSLAHDGYGSESGNTCWMCPVCGSIYELTPAELAMINPYVNYCDYCFYYYGIYTYAYYFIQVPCTADEGGIEYGDDYTEEDESAITDIECEGTVEVTEETETYTCEEDGLETAPEEQESILMVVPPVDYQETELDVPKAHFQEQGFLVDLASKNVTVARGMSGGQVLVDLNLTDVDILEYKAVVFVGGTGIDDQFLYEDEEFLALAKNANDTELVVGAICLAPKVLANAGLLQGKNATVAGDETYYRPPIDYILSKGAIYQNEPVVRDGRIVTGNGPEASKSFAEKIVEVINEGREIAPVVGEGTTLGEAIAGTTTEVPEETGTGVTTEEETDVTTGVVPC